jgi:hypothetical protein
MPTESLSFLSYSRKDYYFAESLAFHLLRQGVPVWLDVRDLEPGKDWERSLEDALDAATTVVLVASADSMESPHVRGEWQRALRQGKRIVIVRFRRARIPDELQRCEIVDFRRPFGRALRVLVARLKTARPDAPEPATTSQGPALVGVPPWIATMTVLLAIPSFAFILLADWDPDPSFNAPAPIQLALIPVLALLVLWFLCVAFLRRRMGMTRLAITLVVLTGVFATPLVLFGLLGQTRAGGYDESIVRAVHDHWRAGLALIAIPLCGLLVLFLFRPEDLLRWTPTGTAWPVYRIGHVADAAFARADLGTRFSLVRRFSLLHDPVDAPMAEQLRTQLGRQGSTEVPNGADDATTVLLLSGRTRTAWVDEQLARPPDRMLTIVASAIRLPESLQRLWRRQWIDFRGWDLRRIDREKALPQVPEAVSQSRFPAVVKRVHHVLCIVGALLFVLVGKMDDYLGPNADPNLGQIVAALGAVWWALTARRLLRRQRSASTFARDCMIGWAATVIAVPLCGYTIAMHEGSIARPLFIVGVLVAAFVWLMRERKDLAFWLPLENGRREKPNQSLAPGRNWRTLLVYTGYLFVWFVVLGGGT